MRKQRRWTEEAALGLGAVTPEGERKKGRYGTVKKITEDGIRFDSKREYLRYLDLKLLEKAGEISDLRVHPKYPITIGGIEIRIYSKRYHKTGRLMFYEADFTYYDRAKEQWIIEDSKGHRNEVYKIKRALMRAMGYEILET